MSATREVHVEHLLGRRVRDRDGRVVGRLEEFGIARANGETIVVEFHVGPAAILERLGGAALQLPFLRALPFSRRLYRIPWTLMDFTDIQHPRVRCALSELEPASLD